MENIKKSLGQHFLIDKNVRKKIINISSLSNKKILEIGPGNGFLTDLIIDQKPKKLILIEKDQNLFIKLKEKYKKFYNVKIYNKDFLKCNINDFENYVIISNLPYNITSKFFNKILISNTKISESILMIQKEVANKIDPEKNKMNKYKFLLNLKSKYKICFYLSPNVFYPKPKIKSAVIHIKFNKKIYDLDKIRLFIQNIFKSRRKIISNLLPFKKKFNNEILKKRVDELNINELKKILKLF